MKESLRIQIPTPCGEDWGRMDRVGRGRFCQNCQKTVVDFTGMTDAEVLEYFSAGSRGAGSRGAGSRGAAEPGPDEAGSRVCGRFLPEQLGRPLAPAAVQRNGWSGWRWVLASALMLLRPPEEGKPVKPVAVERRDRSTVQYETSETVGMVIHTVKTRKKAARAIVDSIRAWRPSIVKMESVKVPDVPAAIPVVNVAIPGAGGELEGRMGAISIVTDSLLKPDSTFLQKVADSVSTLDIFRREEFVTLYPNPIQHGGALHLAWLSDVGKYQLALLDMRGRLVEERVVEVGGMGQVDQWVLPVGLAAGVYVLRIVKDGSGKVDVREVAVR